MPNYSNSPIAEAVCELQFVPNPSTDITAIGLFYEKIRDQFPIKHPQMGIATQTDKDSFSFQMLQRVQFFRPDRSALVQASANIITINRLKPYTDWQEFRELILNNFETFSQITNPEGFKRLGLRYINKIELAEPQTDRLEDYFTIYPVIPKELSETYVNFANQVEIPYKADRDNLRILLRSDPVEETGMRSFVLDLDYHTVTPENVTLEAITEWIETAHESIKNAFERCITDKSRTMFGAEK